MTTTPQQEREAIEITRLIARFYDQSCEDERGAVILWLKKHVISSFARDALFAIGVREPSVEELRGACAAMAYAHDAIERGHHIPQTKG